LHASLLHARGRLEFEGDPIHCASNPGSGNRHHSSRFVRPRITYCGGAKESEMLLIIILVLLIFGSGYGGYRMGPGWGYYGGGGLSLLLTIIVILLLLKVI
jgi:hypothetical protein